MSIPKYKPGTLIWCVESIPLVGRKGHDEFAQWLVDNLVALAQDQSIVKVNHH